MDEPAASIDYRWRVGCAVLHSGRVQCWGNYDGFYSGAGIVITPEFVEW